MVHLILRSNAWFVEPCKMGWNDIHSGLVTGKVTNVFTNSLGDQDNVTTDLNLTGRISAIAIGILLLVPLINLVVLKILKSSNSLYYQKSKSLPSRDDVLAHLETIRQIGDLDAIKDEFYINPEITCLTIEPALRELSAEQPVNQILNFFDWAMQENEDLSPDDKARIKDNFTRSIYFYDACDTKPYKFARRIISLIYSYIERQSSLVERGSAEEASLKEQYQKFVNVVLDSQSRGECIDQSILQFQKALIEIVVFGYGSDKTLSHDERLFHYAAVELAIYRINLATEIVKLQANEFEEAEAALAFFKHNASLLGLPSSIFCVETYVDFTDFFKTQLEESRKKYIEIYDPKKFLWDECLIPETRAKDFRNQVCIYARKSLNLDVDDILADEIERNLCVDPSTTLNFGGTFKPEALTLLLQKANIIIKKSSNPLLRSFESCMFT